MIEITHLTYACRGIAAIRDLTLKVRNGHIGGILTDTADTAQTVARLIVGILPPTDGQVLINGYDIQSEPLAAKRQMAYLPCPCPAPRDMTVFEYLAFVADLRAVDSEAIPRTVHEALVATNLIGMQDRSVATLSPTALVRLCLAATLPGDPDTVILNDPMAGLNSKQRVELGGLIRRLYARKTVLVTGVHTPELAAVCHRIALVTDGDCTEICEPAPDTTPIEEETNGYACCL